MGGNGIIDDEVMMGGEGGDGPNVVEGGEDMVVGDAMVVWVQRICHLVGELSTVGVGSS